MSHRLQRSVRLILIPVIALCVMGLALSNHRDAEVAETLIVDFSMKASGNPYQELYEKILYPTVRISTPTGTGSGVAIGDYILTAAHVVDDQSEVTIEVFYHGDTETPSAPCLRASVVITDTAKDLAFLKPSQRLPYSARLAPKNYTPYIFMPVYAVGCSLGLSPRPSAGIISVVDKDYWEVTSPILPGNSGGPVFDARTCEVIGIAIWVHTYNNQIITTMGGIVPIQEIYKFLMTNDECLKKSQ